MTDNGDQPWLAHEDWKNGQIHSDAALAWKVLAGFALFWNVFSFGIAGAIMLDNPPRFPDGAYLVLLFPAVGLLLAWQALKQYLDWKRHGRLNLTLDPYPGSIGGEVGGYLTLPARPAELSDLEAMLSCVKVSVSRSSKNSSRSENIVWRQRVNTQVELAAKGARISFLTTTEAGLPNSQPPSNSHHQWLLNLSSKQAGLNRSFDIPVFDTGRNEPSRLRIDPTPPSTEQHQFPAEVVQVQRRPDGLELIYPSSRRGGTPWVMTVFGLVFAGIGVFLGVQSVNSGSLFTSGITGFMSLIFSLVGVAIAAGGLYLKFNELRVLIGRDTVHIRRHIGPWKRLRSAPVATLGAVDKNITLQSGQGATATVYYTLKATGADGNKLVLGDGIKGQPLADGLLALIRQELPEPSSTAADRPGPRVETNQIDKEKVQRIVKAVKWFVHIIALVFVLLFFWQFFG